ncbi:hypothetical protein PMIN03_000737 [Paraphaeosphaeria minitans]
MYTWVPTYLPARLAPTTLESRPAKHLSSAYLTVLTCTLYPSTPQTKTQRDELASLRSFVVVVVTITISTPMKS